MLTKFKCVAQLFQYVILKNNNNNNNCTNCHTAKLQIFDFETLHVEKKC